MLVSEDLIVVRLAELAGFSSSGRPSNEYWLRGKTSDDIRETASRVNAQRKWNSVATPDDFS